MDVCAGAALRGDAEMQTEPSASGSLLQSVDPGQMRGPVMWQESLKLSSWLCIQGRALCQPGQGQAEQ